MAPARRRQREFKSHAFRVALQFDPLDLLELLDARLHLAGLIGLIAETIDKLLDPRNFFGLAISGGFQLGVARGTKFFELGVVPSKLLNLFVADLPNMRGDSIEKRGVVTDYKQRQS